MVIFTPIEEIKAKGKVKKVSDSIKKERKIKAIPNFWKTIANDPDTLERTWNSLKDIMKKGALDPLTKEMIYIAVSMTNSCEYCIRSHSSAAKKKGIIAASPKPSIIGGAEISKPPFKLNLAAMICYLSLIQCW